MHFCTLVIIEDPGTRELAYIKDEVAVVRDPNWHPWGIEW